MEGDVLGEDALQQKLRDSRRRFQRRMQRLIEKYNQPFEDAPLVQMSTLTYETPQGLRIWGGGLVKERNEGHIQDSHVRTVGRKDDPEQAAARGHELPTAYTATLGEDSKSDDVDGTVYPEDLAAGALVPAAPRNPLKNELRRKYLTQVDILLQDEGYFQRASYGGGKDTCGTLVRSLTLPARHAHGCCDIISEKSPGSPIKPASSPRESGPSHSCSTDLAVVPRNDSLLLQGAGGNSLSSSQSFEAEDICDVTISDMYAGMLHSMSRLLSTKPSCIISTKTFIIQNWNSRQRFRHKGRVNRTRCRAGRHLRRSPQEGPSACPEPAKEVGALRACENLLSASGHKTGLKLGKAILEVNKLQIHKLDPSWKELKGTFQKDSSLTSLDSGAMYRLDQENRIRALKWLISPVKIVSRPRTLPCEGGKHYREIEIKFDKLHQEYCPDPRKQSCLTYLPSSSAVDVYRGGPASPGGPRSLETHRPNSLHIKAKAKKLNEAFENLGRSLDADRCLPTGDSSLSLSKTNPTWSPGRSEQTAGLLFQGNSLGIFRKSMSPSKAISVPRIRPLSCGRGRYDEIKEKFDKLHQKYCQTSPQRMKAPLCIGASPDEASVKAQYQKEDFLGKVNPDFGFQGSLKLSSSPQRSVRGPLGSTTVEVHPSTCFVSAAGKDHESPAKRCRLSDPGVYGQSASSRDSSRVVRKAIPRPGEEVGPSQRDWEEKKRKEQHIFEDGREK
uniref:Holliday junction recognition protein n=1 Tax=Equus caballus TaxID=9796 RepID=F7B865_HORSE|nr:Holliday junction recognition protein [Equus caballus]